jgi:hypothetical protein
MDLRAPQAHLTLRLALVAAAARRLLGQTVETVVQVEALAQTTLQQLAEQVFLEKGTLVETRQILLSTLAQAAAARVQPEPMRAARTVLQQAALLATAEMVRHSHQMQRHTPAVEAVETSIRPECLVLAELEEVEMANVDPPHRP